MLEEVIISNKISVLNKQVNSLFSSEQLSRILIMYPSFSLWLSSKKMNIFSLWYEIILNFNSIKSLLSSTVIFCTSAYKFGISTFNFSKAKDLFEFTIIVWLL